MIQIHLVKQQNQKVESNQKWLKIQCVDFSVIINVKF